jgi:short-subunit dehydrogenase
MNQQFLRKYGPWALVTGASDGVGQASAKLLASMGLNLVLVARSQEKLAHLAKQFANENNIQVRVLALDLSVAEAAEELKLATSDLEIGLLIASAGFGSSGKFLDANEVTELQMLNVNCNAVLVQCLHFGKLMAQKQKGGLILLSSVLAFQGTPYSANYGATKAYIQSFAEGIADEFQAHGVDVLSVAPGPIASGFAQRANMVLGQSLAPDVVAKQAIDSLGKRRLVRPGALSKLLGWGLSTAPRALRVQLIGSIMRGMTKHQRPPA